MTLLQIQDGGVPTKRNTLANYSHCPLTHISIQVIYTTIQSDLRSHKHNYLFYYLRKFLRILKFGYLATNVVINSGLLSCTLIMCSLRNTSRLMNTLSKFQSLLLVQLKTLQMDTYMYFWYVHWLMEMLIILHVHIKMHHPVTPWDCTISWVIQNIPENHLRQKLLNPIFQTEDSRF